jgi:hypothetical protein
VWVPQTRWAEELVEEVAGFPFMSNDDLVDTTIMALMRFRQGGFISLPTDEVESAAFVQAPWRILLMAEKTKFQSWLDGLTPEQRAAFDASVEFGDQEYMGELQNNLPPELRFGGEFGGISALGYGKGTNDDRAQIRGYTKAGV